MPSLSAVPNVPPKSKSSSKTRRPRNASKSGSDDEKQMPNTIAHDWSAAVLEWGELLHLKAGQYRANRDKIIAHIAPHNKYSEFEYSKIPSESEFTRCVCSHNIREVYHVHHVSSGITLVMGSTCIKYFDCAWATSEITRLRFESIGRVRCRALCGRMAPAGEQMHLACENRLKKIGRAAVGKHRICGKCKLPSAECDCTTCKKCAAIGLSCPDGKCKNRRVRCRALCGRIAPNGTKMHKTCAKRLEHIGRVARGNHRRCGQCKLPVALCKCFKCEDCAALGLSCTGGVGFTYCGKHSERRNTEEKARKDLAELRWQVARGAARRCIYLMRDKAKEQNDEAGSAEATARIRYHREEVSRRTDRIEAEQEAIASAIAAEKTKAERKRAQRAAQIADEQARDERAAAFKRIESAKQRRIELAKYPCIKCKKQNTRMLAVPRASGARKYCQFHLDDHERRKKERAAEVLRVHNAKRAKRKAKRKAKRAKRKQS